MRLLRAPLLVVLLCVAVFATAGGALGGTGPLQRLTLVSRHRIAPGVVFTHWRARVSGVADTQDVYRVAWTLGDSHIGLHSARMGALHPNGTIDIHPISGWAAAAHPRGLVAAMNGDFFDWTSSTTARPSGMFVQYRHLVQPGWGGAGGAPSVGFGPGGALVFGRPRPLPLRFFLPGGHSATIHGFGVAPLKGDQVGVFHRAGQTVTIPTGDTAVILENPLHHLITGAVTSQNPTGLNVSETVAAFTLTGLKATVQTITVPIAPVASTTAVTVGRGDSVLLMTAAGQAAAGFRALLAEPTPAVRMTTSDRAWQPVSDVISGKPQVVKDGQPLTTKPAYVTDDQWYPQQYRPAIATSTTGQGWLIIIGSTHGLNGTSLTGVQFGRVLAALGAKNALQLDNRHSSELFLHASASVPSNGLCSGGPGACYTIQPHYERSIPEAAYLTYH